MRVVVDTGVFSAALSRRRRAALDEPVGLLGGNQLFLAAASVAELRYGAIVAEWGPARRERLERAIGATTVIPVSDALLSTVAELRAVCRRIGHPLADRVHGNDLWIAGSAVHVGLALVTADRVFAETPGLTLLPRHRRLRHHLRLAHLDGPNPANAVPTDSRVPPGAPKIVGTERSRAVPFGPA